jgi:hypothetical protein
MVIEKFPGSDEDRREKEGSRAKGDSIFMEPEYIILDGQEEEPNSSNKEFVDVFSTIKKMPIPFLYRFAFLGLAIACFAASFILLFALLLASLWSLTGLFKEKRLNQPLVRFWKIYCRSLVMGLGFFIAAFNPPLGFLTLFLYFMLEGEVNQSEWLRSFLRSSGR